MLCVGALLRQFPLAILGNLTSTCTFAQSPIKPTKPTKPNQPNQSPISLQEEVEAAWAAVEEGVAGEAEKKKKDWLDSHKEEVSVSAPMTSGLASTQSPVASEQQVTKVGEKGKDSSRDVAASVLSSGAGTVTAQKSVASASRPEIASKEDAAAPVLTLVKGKGSKNVAAVAAATLVKTVKSSQIHSS